MDERERSRVHERPGCHFGHGERFYSLFRMGSEAKATKRPAGEQYPRNSSFHHHGISELTHRDWYTGHVKCSKCFIG